MITSQRKEQYLKRQNILQKKIIPTLKEATTKLVTKFEGRIRIIDFM